MTMTTSKVKIRQTFLKTKLLVGKTFLRISCLPRLGLGWGGWGWEEQLAFIGD